MTEQEKELEKIFRLCHKLKKDNKKIAFTHGGFDLFHYGHLYLLKESKKFCDHLIVSVDTDESLSSYKKDRPIISQDRRNAIVEALKVVDTSFVNPLPTTDESYSYLYKELKADVITIGRRFGFEDQIKNRTKRLKTKLVKIDNDHESTTEIIKRILKLYSK